MKKKFLGLALASIVSMLISAYAVYQMEKKDSNTFVSSEVEALANGEMTTGNTWQTCGHCPGRGIVLKCVPMWTTEFCYHPECFSNSW